MRTFDEIAHACSGSWNGHRPWAHINQTILRKRIHPCEKYHPGCGVETGGGEQIRPPCSHTRRRRGQPPSLSVTVGPHGGGAIKRWWCRAILSPPRRTHDRHHQRQHNRKQGPAAPHSGQEEFQRKQRRKGNRKHQRSRQLCVREGEEGARTAVALRGKAQSHPSLPL